MGRHAVQVALDRDDDVEHITVISQHSETLKDENWNCGCTAPHKCTDEDRLTIVQIDSWKEDDDILKHFEGANAVISCLGNRQISLGDHVGGEGSRLVVKAMNQYKIERAVIISSVGIKDDWPPADFHWGGKIMSCIFMTCGRKAFKDLTSVEEAFQPSKDIDNLIVRPLGLGEDVVPQNKWVFRKRNTRTRASALIWPS